MRSNDYLGKTFADMFSQLKSLYNCNLARTKSMYVINHGLAPFIKSMLNDSLHRGYTDLRDGYLDKVME